ncbi:MAG: hypothetical protein ABMA26_19430 [Limisphaerales bacterium]
MKARLAIAAMLLLCAAGVIAQPKASSDARVAGAVLFPRGIATNALQPDAFSALGAEHLAEQLKVRWQPAAPPTRPRLTLHYSADFPGHWPSRDWRTLPLTQRGAVWEATLPVEELDVPLVYFVSDGSPTPALLSSMRVVSPRLAGMEKPSRVFWPFLDGFEEGVTGWELASDSATIPQLKASPSAHDGNAALSVTIPAGQRSVTVSTTRVRGWHYSLQLATGLRVWLRAPGGSGRSRFTLHANAGTTNAISALSAVEAALDDKWRKVDLSFSSFPNFPVVGTDLFSIEFIGEGPREFLVDDLRLLGRWKLPGD